MKVVTAEQMQAIDQAAAAMGLTTDILMENAGRAIAEETRKLLTGVIAKQILILIGPGNNGGDGLVAARYLDDWGADVTLYLCSPRKPDDKNLAAAQERKIPVLYAADDTTGHQLSGLLDSTKVIIDAIFGTGQSRSLDGIFKQVIDKVNDAKNKRPDTYLIAVDLPSGLNANTGEVDPSCPWADATITLGFPKPGLYNFPGAEKAGKVIITDIGIPPELAADIKTEVISPEWVGANLPPRPADANKGTFGKILAVIGSINYTGAAYLACSGAIRVGAGLVTLAIAKSIQSIVASKLTEVTYLPLPEAEDGIISSTASTIISKSIPGYNVLLAGCGSGQHPEVKRAFKSILFDKQKTQALSIILDADALTIMSEEPEWWQRLGENVILTPHPGEMARLAKITIEEVQKNRLALATEKAREWNKVVVLKGAYTVIASPDGRAMINTMANPGLASAGTGDVLSGIIAGLAAQGMPLFEAAACGVFLHGEAARIVADEIGNAGMIASDLPPILPKLIKRLKETN